MEYWIDSDPGFGKGTNITLTKALDISNLLDTLPNQLDIGNHILGIRSMDSLNKWSHTNMMFFEVIPDDSSERLTQIELVVDDDKGFGSSSYKYNIDSNEINSKFIVEALNLTPGNHIIHLRSKSETGEWSLTNSMFIESLDSNPTPKINQVEYYWDDDKGFATGTMAAVDSNVIDLNDSFISAFVPRNISVGKHQLYMRSWNENGKSSHTNYVGEFDVWELLKDTVFVNQTLYCQTYTTKNGFVISKDTQMLEAVVVLGSKYQIHSYDVKIIRDIHLTLSPSVCDAYISPSGKIYGMSGTYRDTVLNSSKCDTFYTINLNVLSSASEISEQVCDSFKSPSGKRVWKTSGIYYDVITNSSGCDSNITINLSVLNSSSTISQSVCDSFISPSGNEVWKTTGTYYDVIPNASGCDSNITINLTVEKSFNSVSVESCYRYVSPSGKYVWDTSGMYKDTLVNAAGCDSVMTIDLSIKTVDVRVLLSDSVLEAKANSGTFQWLDCKPTFAEISGETSKTFMPTYSSDFAVEVTDNGCVDTSECYSFELASDSEYIEREITIYPNPANNQDLTIVNTANVYMKIKIYNSLGQIIVDFEGGNLEEIPFKNYSSGLYIITILAEDENYQFKVINQ